LNILACRKIVKVAAVLFPPTKGGDRLSGADYSAQGPSQLVFKSPFPISWPILLPIFGKPDSTPNSAETSYLKPCLLGRCHLDERIIWLFY
jgi:hypothetical protein